MVSLKELKQIGKREVPASKERKHYIDRISPWLKKKEIIIIKGIRRSGKTHIMYQLMKKIPKKDVFYFNFEDYIFENLRDTKLLDKIISLRKSERKTYFFFDEIQQVKGFERWLRTWYDKEMPIQFIIGGSNISLLTPHLATVLTGRNITFTVKPLSWNEAKEFTNTSFNAYLAYGGFPEILLEKNEGRKKEQLQQYIHDIIIKDILFKHTAENTRLIESMAHYFISNPGVKISANKLGSQLGVSKETAQKYLEIIKDTFLIFEVPYFSYSAKTKYIGNRASKYYVVDNGFITAISIKENKGILYENLVAVHLHSREINEKVCYWHDVVEIDFVYRDKAIQVTSTNNIPRRELGAFDIFSKRYKKFKHILITPKSSKDSFGLQEFLESTEK